MKRQRTGRFTFILILIISMIFNGVFWQGNIPVTEAATTGIIKATSLNVRTGAGTSNSILQSGGKNVALKSGTRVSILSSKSGWYYVSFSYSGKSLKGYVLASYVSLAPETTTYKSSLINLKSGSATDTVYVTKSYPLILGKNVKANWKTGNKQVATVGLTGGILKPVAPGNVTITAKSLKTGKSYKKTYIVKLRATKLVVSNNLTMKIGEKKQLKAVKTPSNSTDVIRFRTDNAKVATVGLTGGLLTAKGNGEATITVYSKATTGSPYSSSNNRVVKFKVYVGTVDKNQTTRIGTVSTSSLKVRKGAGTSYDQLTYNSKSVTVTKGQKVTILSEKKVGSTMWYEVSFIFNNKNLVGYVSGDYVTLDPVDNTPKEPTQDKNDEEIGEPGILGSEEFEAALTQEGFPESYKPFLRTLHQQYPTWQFKALQTGLDWKTVIAKQSVPGKNLITNSRTVNWKSMEGVTYNWSTDEFKVYDGLAWVTASKAAISYYMDPRNFLTASGIFQFEALEYKKDYQTKAGVERILGNTALGNKTYSYIDSETKASKSFTYGTTFIKAAEYSGVSPFHLATRAKQEVVTGKETLSTSVSGTVKGYEGLYNFYNIGATHSTVKGGSVANALNYAKNGSTEANNKLFLIPWTNPYNSIVGGAKFIGNNYINKGQNTMYLQKFNVTSYSTYSHQYMANVEASNSESIKTFAAYSSMTDLPIMFSIPVYQNMPAKPCPAPSGGLNPNNWLKTLTVDKYELIPKFNIADAGSLEYTVNVTSDIQNVTISAIPVSMKATVSGTGAITLKNGKNPVTIQVTAENGDKKNYVVNIVKAP